MFITFEGLDNVGKTTQCVLLNEKIPSVMYRFPTRKGVIGNILDQYLKGQFEISDQSIHLLFSADRWETINQITDDLKNGKTVIVDRYVPSGIAYSTAKGLSYDWCRNCDIGLPIPDIIFFLYSSKVMSGIEKYETESFQKKVSDAYQLVAETFRNVWFAIDVTDKSPENINEIIMDRLKKIKISMKTT